MVKAVTFGYRWEGLALHQWAFTHTDLQLIVMPGNRIWEGSWSTVTQWGSYFRVPMWCQGSENDPELTKRIRDLKPDIILCYCYSYKLNEEILRVPVKGCINIHPGKLPEYRGKDPIKAAMDNKDRYLEVTLHKMDEGFDTGEVISSERVINKGDIQVNRSLLTKEGIKLLEDNWSKIVR